MKDVNKYLPLPPHCEHEVDRSEIKRLDIGANLTSINGLDVIYIDPPPSKEWVLDAIRKAAGN